MTRFLLILALLVGAVFIGSLAGCATLKTCDQPVTGQVLQDSAAVLVCVNTGKTLAACEDAQLAVEAGQLSSDLLVCGELAIAKAATGTHTTADAGAP